MSKKDGLCTVCGNPRDGKSTSGMCKACEADYRARRRQQGPMALDDPKRAFNLGRHMEKPKPQPHKDILTSTPDTAPPRPARTYAAFDAERENQASRRETHRTEAPAPALPIPQARFAVGHVPRMPRSTRRERLEEVHPLFRPFLHPWSQETSELTLEEKKRYGR